MATANLDHKDFPKYLSEGQSPKRAKARGILRGFQEDAKPNFTEYIDGAPARSAKNTKRTELPATGYRWVVKTPGLS